MVQRALAINIGFSAVGDLERVKWVFYYYSRFRLSVKRSKFSIDNIARQNDRRC